MFGYSVEPTLRMVQRLSLPPPTMLTLILSVLVTYGPFCDRKMAFSSWKICCQIHPPWHAWAATGLAPRQASVGTSFETRKPLARGNPIKGRDAERFELQIH